MSRIAEPEILDLLTRLVEKSLVVYEEDEQGNGRYRLLETVRQYARDRLLESGAAAEVRHRHGDWFLALAEEAEPRLWGTDQVRWFDALEAEHDNLRAALDWLVQTGQVEEALRLASALRRLWSVRGHCVEGRRRLEEALALTQGPESARARAAALYAAGILAAQQGDYAVARPLHEQSLALRRQLRDTDGTGLSLIYLGQTLFAEGDYAAASALYEEALALGRQVGDRSRTAFALDNLGSVAICQRDLERAHALFEEALALRRQLGDKHYAAFSLDGLGDVARCRGDYEIAAALYEESFALRRELMDKHCTGTSLYKLANLARDRGDGPGARSLYEQSLALRQEQGEREGMIACLEGLAGLTAASGEPERAVRLFAAEAACRGSPGAPPFAMEREERDRRLAAIRERMPAETFAAAWKGGQAMTLEQAVADALKDGGD